MMMFVLGMLMFVLGMLAWQVVTAVVYFVSEDDEKGAMFGSGICTLVLMGVGAIIRKIRLHNSRKYNMYQFFGRKDANGKPIWLTTYYMTEQDAERFNVIGCNAEPAPWCVRLFRTGKELKNAPLQEQILTAEMIENGDSGMSKEFFEKYFKRA